MNWRANRPLRERLAAEYALGTLRGRARARFERWLREDAALARTVAEWQERLAPLAAGVPPVAPPARLWRGIAEHIGRAGGGSLWENLPFWRALGLAASGMAAILLAAVALVSPAPPAPAPAPVVVKVPSAEMAEIYLAVLSDPKTQKPLLLITANRRAEQMQVRTLDPSIRVSGKDLELWALPKDGKPASLGLVGEAERATVKLASVAERSLGDAPALAVSLEPKGGAPGGAPTGPVLAVGPCIKVW